MLGGHMNQTLPNGDLKRLQIGAVAVEPLSRSCVVAAAMPGTVYFSPDQRAQMKWQNTATAAVPIGENTLFGGAQQHGCAVDLYRLERIGRQVCLGECHLPFRRPTAKAQGLQRDKACRVGLLDRGVAGHRAERLAGNQIVQDKQSLYRGVGSHAVYQALTAQFRDQFKKPPDAGAM